MEGKTGFHLWRRFSLFVPSVAFKSQSSLQLLISAISHELNWIFLSVPSKSYYEDNWCTKRKKPDKCYNLELLKPAFMLDMIVRLTCFRVLLVRACRAVNCSKTREAISTQPAVLTKEFCNIVPLVLSFPTYLTYLTGTPGRNIRMLKLFIIFDSEVVVSETEREW